MLMGSTVALEGHFHVVRAEIAHGEVVDGDGAVEHG